MIILYINDNDNNNNDKYENNNNSNDCLKNGTCLAKSHDHTLGRVIACEDEEQLLDLGKENGYFCLKKERKKFIFPYQEIMGSFIRRNLEM